MEPSGTSNTGTMIWFCNNVKDVIVMNLFGEWIFSYTEFIYFLLLFLLYLEFYYIKLIHYMLLEEKRQ